ncbi:thioesterase [Enterocloster clostridioformis]|uniref:thioesterase II family protein n=1 Tax=Enterocloster clostridioformis TaxID=1531 RepID=UPI00080C5B57|nr:thioesterase domain-containing protein [Enterocloster clostridioformis]QQR01367.1 thioesterase [Enterocloster clostridioformis]
MNKDGEIYLFCFPHAGGWPSIYGMWELWISSKIVVAPIQLPGRGERLDEEPLEDFNYLIKDIVQEVKKYVGSRIAFYGSCFGGLCAFEVARKMVEINNVKIEHLFISSQAAPSLENSSKHLSDLKEEQFVQELILEGALSEKILEDKEILDILVPSLRSDYKMYDNYTYMKARKKLECPITVFKGKSDESVTMETMKEWAKETTGEFKFLEISGKHLFNKIEQRVIVEEISKTLLKEDGEWI